MTHQTDLQIIQTRLAETMPDVHIKDAHRLGGMTNRTYHIQTTDGQDLVVRLPGEGTDELINRADERISTELATRIGIDAPLLRFDPDGFKVTTYIQGAHTMSAEDLRNPSQIPAVAEIFRTLHSTGVDTGVPFEVFTMAAQYESLITKNNVALPSDYAETKATVMSIKAQTDTESESKRVPCHNDSLCANWVLGDDRLYLIDWEYAGMNDPLWDLADVSIEAEYTPEHDQALLEAYFGHPLTPVEHRRFLANKIYLDYLWTLWGLTRVPYDGATMQTYADERYARLHESIRAYQST